MTKLEAWNKWCEEAHVTDATEYTLEKSSHGKAFSYAWDAAVEAEREEILKLSDALGWIPIEAVRARGEA